MKKWLITSVCFICFCSTNVSNVINAMDATESARIGAEYLSQIKELKRVQQEHFSILELRNKIERELMADMRATGDQELIAEIDHRSHFCVSGFRGFCYFAFGMPNRRLLCQEIADCEYILLNKYVRLFDNVLAGGDPKWEFLKEQISNRPASSIFNYFLNSHKYETEDICPYEFVKSNPLTKDIVDHMYEEFADWTDSKLDDLYEKYYKKLNVDNKTWEFFRWACFSDKIPHIYHSSIPSDTNFYPEYNQRLNKALKRHGELKEQVEILDRIFVEAELADIHERAISNKIAWYLRKHEAICNDALNRSKKEELEQEVYDASRALTPNELKDVTPLMSMIAQKHGISDVRVIDAESLITSMHLPEPEKQRLLYLLKHGSQEEIDAEIHRFLDESEFSDIIISQSLMRYSNIRNDVTSALLWGAHYSPIYRDQILTLIAWSRVTEPALYDIEKYGLPTNPGHYQRKISFNATLEGSNASYNNINMNFLEVVYLYGISLDTSSHVALFYDPNRKVIFHEIGHVISGNIGYIIDTEESSRQKTMDIAAESVIRRKDKSMIAENMAFLRSLPVDKIDQLREEVNLIFSKSGIRGLQLEISDNTEFLETIERLYTSDSMFTNVALVQNTTELMQILGLFSHTHKGNHVLYINKLSDAAVNAFAKRPIRVDHDGETSNENDPSNLKRSELFEDIMRRLKPAAKRELNLDFYKALISAFGMNASEYFDRDSTAIVPLHYYSRYSSLFEH